MEADVLRQQLLCSPLLCSPLLLAQARSTVWKLLPFFSFGSVFSGERNYPGLAEGALLDLLATEEVQGISLKVRVLRRDVTTSGEIL